MPLTSAWPYGESPTPATSQSDRGDRQAESKVGKRSATRQIAELSNVVVLKKQPPPFASERAPSRGPIKTYVTGTLLYGLALSSLAKD